MATLGLVERPGSLARPARAVRRVVRRGDRSRGSRPRADGSRHRHARCCAVGPDGAAQGARSTRVRLLHEPHEPQGRRASGEPTSRGCPALEAARAPGAPGGHRSTELAAERVRRVLRVRGRGTARSAPGRRRSRNRSRIAASSSAGRRDRGAVQRRRRGAAAAVLGRIPHRGDDDRVLAGAARAAPRPRPVRPRLRRLGEARLAP